MTQYGPVCVGIDPHAALLESWGLPVSASGVREFSLRTVEAMAGTVAAVKPQASFYERFGSAGVAALEETIAACREAELLCIVDAKRGDIGSTMAGYAHAFLSDASPLAGDAVTLSPYLGFGSLAPAITLAESTGRGVFVLCLTSNPEGATVQHARAGDTATVAATIAAQAAEANRGAVPLGHVGLVIGATIGSALADTGTDLENLNGPILAPGFGAQGAGPADLARVFGPAAHLVLATTSRAVLQAGPDTASLRGAAANIVAEFSAVS
jgi:orotidine-5'-phosphate decarboxylase